MFVYTFIIATDQVFLWIYPDLVTIVYLVALPVFRGRNTQYKATYPTVYTFGS